MKKSERQNARKISGKAQRACQLTLGQWMDIWERDYLVGVKESTAFLYREQIKLYIKPMLGDIKLKALDVHIIQRFCNALVDHHKGQPNLAPKTVKNIHGILHNALQQAVATRLIDFNPAHGCVLPHIEKKSIQPLDEAQITTFLDLIQGHKHELLYKVALFTGLREGELLGLQWDCVDFKRGTILVKQQLQRSRQKGGQYYFSSPKNGKSRVLTPAPWVMGLLQEQKNRQEEQRVDAGTTWENTGLVFANETGGYLSYRTVYDCFKRIMKQMGTPTTRFHDLRHTFAVTSIRAGDDIKTVQENLGHHSAAFTLDVYGHVTDQMKKDSAMRMQAYIQETFNF